MAASPVRALANGAFPDSQSILLPVDRPNEIVLATNFGLITSIDGGQTWTWACEQGPSTGGRLYQEGPPPLDRIFTVSTAGLVYSDDGACSWKTAGGGVPGSAVSDAFADPSNPDRVMAILVPQAAGGIYTIYESSDGGATLGTLRFTAAAGDILTGVEIARSDPRVVYLTIASGDTFSPKLVRTSNGGADWQTTDLSPALGTHKVSIVSVDPESADKVLLRVTSTSPSADSLAVTDDGGAHFVTPLSVAGGILTSFTRLPNGVLLLAGVAGTDYVIFRSADGGMTFGQAPAPALRALGTRDGRLFGAADNFDADPALAFALGESTDEGQTWRPMMTYDEVQAITGCLKAACQTDCQTQVDRDLWSGDLCLGDPMPLPVDGGADGALTDAAADADGTGGATGSGADAAGETRAVTSSGGCSCRAASGSSPADGWAASVLALGAALARLRGRARRRSRGSCRSPARGPR